MVCLSRQCHFKFFKGCLPQISLVRLNTLLASVFILYPLKTPEETPPILCHRSFSKLPGFPMFSEGIERGHWHEMGERLHNIF